MKTNKGITLVALIITIIVMVILVGVIIVSAVTDGGIIERTQTAMKENERAEVEDLVTASHVYSVTTLTNSDGYLDLEETARAIYENLSENGFDLYNVVEVEENGTTIKTLEVENNKIYLKVQGKYGEYEGIIEKRGLKDGIKKSNEIKDNLVSGKSYMGTYMEDDGTEQAIFVAFCTKSNKAFMYLSLNSNFDAYTYNYNKENRTVTINEMNLTFNVSQDGNRISREIDGVIYEAEIANDIIGTKENSAGKIWNGYYYNSEIDRYIKFYINEETSEQSVLIKIENDSRYYSGGGGSVDHYTNALTATEITVIDSTHLELDGYEYTLITSSWLKDN